ncbi:unnamed protein product, partial [Closterium sp. NIES-53]
KAGHGMCRMLRHLAESPLSPNAPHHTLFPFLAPPPSFLAPPSFLVCTRHPTSLRFSASWPTIWCNSSPRLSSSFALSTPLHPPHTLLALPTHTSATWSTIFCSTSPRLSSSSTATM